MLHTPLTAGQAAQLIETAWARRSALRNDVPQPTPERVRLLLALWDLETGTGGSQFNFNFGNQIATRPDQNFYVADDSGNTRHFRAYTDALAGARSFVSQLTSDTRPQWVAGLATGDPTEFVRSLKGLNGGPEYFEAPFERYRNTFLARWERYAPKARPPRRGTVQVEGDSGLAWMTFAAAAAALATYLYSSRARRNRE